MDIVWQSEDSLREKKVESDLGDLLRTLVAFANSVGPDDTAQLFIGEKDDDTVQGVTNVDSIQKRIKMKLTKSTRESITGQKSMSDRASSARALTSRATV